MTKLQNTILFLSVFFVIVSAPVSADIIYMRDGKTQTGIITKNLANSPSVSIQTSVGEISIPRAKIDRIEPESKSMGCMHIGDQFAESRKFDDAIVSYKQALELDKANAELQKKLSQAESARSEAVKANKVDASAKLDEAMTRTRELLKEKKYAEALKTLRAADPGDDSIKPAELKQLYAELYYQWGVDRADRQDSAGATEKLQMALRLDPKNEAARQKLVRVWEGDPSKIQEVVIYYKDSTSLEDQLKLADAYFKLKNYEAALPIYLKCAQDPKLSNQIAKDRIRLMYDILHRQAADQGDYEKALAIYHQFLEYSPTEDPQVTARYEYMIQRGKINQSDPDSRATLAKFAEDHGMPETARKEYLNILVLAPDNKAALYGLRRFADADMKDASDFFAEGQFLLAKHKVGEISKNYPMFPEIVKQAQELDAKADVEQQKVARTRQQQAVALALRGDDYYNQALAYISSYTSKEVDPNKRVFNAKTEAVKYLQRAIYSWRTALSIDSSLGDPASYDLYTKISDAYSRYTVLANPVPLPQPRLNITNPKR
ncbi:MAG: hypothetical protein NTY46_09980 [Candidatus Sumerlaeota bacterium]|nr:hypothetical protein [Candidatus Sumerlaeota bacterium]